MRVLYVRLLGLDVERLLCRCGHELLDAHHLVLGRDLDCLGRGGRLHDAPLHFLVLGRDLDAAHDLAGPVVDLLDQAAALLPRDVCGAHEHLLGHHLVGRRNLDLLGRRLAHEHLLLDPLVLRVRRLELLRRLAYDDFVLAVLVLRGLEELRIASARGCVAGQACGERGRDGEVLRDGRLIALAGSPDEARGLGGDRLRHGLHLGRHRHELLIGGPDDDGVLDRLVLGRDHFDALGRFARHDRLLDVLVLSRNHHLREALTRLRVRQPVEALRAGRLVNEERQRESRYAHHSFQHVASGSGRRRVAANRSALFDPGSGKPGIA